MSAAIFRVFRGILYPKVFGGVDKGVRILDTLAFFNARGTVRMLRKEVQKRSQKPYQIKRYTHTRSLSLSEGRWNSGASKVERKPVYMGLIKFILLGEEKKSWLSRGFCSWLALEGGDMTYLRSEFKATHSRIICLTTTGVKIIQNLTLTKPLKRIEQKDKVYEKFRKILG